MPSFIELMIDFIHPSVNSILSKNIVKSSQKTSQNDIYSIFLFIFFKNKFEIRKIEPRIPRLK